MRTRARGASQLLALIWFGTLMLPALGAAIFCICIALATATHGRAPSGDGVLYWA